MNKSKILQGTAVVALLATMVYATAASAATFQMTSYPNHFTASQVGEEVFTVDGNTIKCKKSESTSVTQAGATKEVTVKAHYTECTATSPATINMKSCDFKLTEPAGSGDTYTGGVKIECTNSSELITIVSSNAFGTCEITIGAQTLFSGKTYHNTTGSPGKVEITTDLTGVHANVVKDTGICPLAGTGTRTNVSIAGTTLAAATGGAGFFIG